VSHASSDSPPFRQAVDLWTGLSKIISMCHYPVAASEVQSGLAVEGVRGAANPVRSEFQMVCEIVEVRNLADALGDPCRKQANGRCADCGLAICSTHTETCNICSRTFCHACLGFHKAVHPKSAATERDIGHRKTA